MGSGFAPQVRPGMTAEVRSQRAGTVVVSGRTRSAGDGKAIGVQRFRGSLPTLRAPGMTVERSSPLPHGRGRGAGLATGPGSCNPPGMTRRVVVPERTNAQRHPVRPSYAASGEFALKQSSACKSVALCAGDRAAMCGPSPLDQTSARRDREVADFQGIQAVQPAGRRNFPIAVRPSFSPFRSPTATSDSYFQRTSDNQW
jgi:hypothetical protein